MSQELETILVALHERRNRLVQLDISGTVSDRSVGTLRSRINEVSHAIRYVKGLQANA